MKRILQTIGLSSMSLLGLWIINPLTVAAAAKTCTWKTTGGADSNFSNAANWSDCASAAPVDGDTIVFKDLGVAAPATKTLTNDIANFKPAEIKVQSHTIFQNLEIDSASTISITKVTVENNKTLKFNGPIKLTADSTITLGEKDKDTLNPILTFDSTLDLNDKNLTVTTPGDLEYPVSEKYYLPYPGMPQITFSNAITGANANKIKISNSIVNLNGDNSSTLKSSIELNKSTIYRFNDKNLGTSPIVLNDSLLAITNTGKTTITNDIVFNGNLFGSTKDDYIKSGLRGLHIREDNEDDVIFEGKIEFKKDTFIQVKATDGDRTVSFTGDFAGPGAPFLDETGEGYVINIISDKNTSQVPNGKYVTLDGAVTSSTLELKDDMSDDDLVIPNTVTALVTGKRGNIVLLTGAVLKGTGTVKNVYVNSGASIVPGKSPGCLSTGNIEYVGASTLTIEIEGSEECAKYDQLNVAGTVKLGNSVTLDLVKASGYKPEVKTKFTIIKNDGDDAVTGTFKGLEEGATIKKDDMEYTISYKGGDGNDVVLTVSKLPGTPDTGIMRIAKFSNLIIIGTVVTAVSIGLISSKKGFARSKR